MRKTLLLILSFFLVACEGEEMPLNFVYVIDVPHMVCAKKAVIDKEKLVLQHVEDLPLIACDGGVLIAKEDWLGFKDWIKWAIQKIKSKSGSCSHSGTDGV